eukprot:CAMPEP_0204877870 /NCGR_PEP_ID=MMETSP1348-20121228/48433_1 /ASSEMBLY_ACC=CAM_ASM_000700 /TAXON_ID=215587 /ORGANISM="Aplanochytrium stocchinoi, Strain GSBS06" /LENGTH=266 /DNA_ID=CAMNT_0052034787 /DNA_START=27 /DNA_END=824 /DNA_ORIENTATION=-
MQIALVTGANKGIGLAICGRLLRQGNIYVLLGSRDIGRGKAAVDSLHSQGLKDVEAIQLDVSDEGSIAFAKEEIHKRFKHLDILVNNAGIAWKGDAFDAEVASGTLNVNYFGTLNVTNAFLPVMNINSRIVNVSSRAGKLCSLSPQLRAQFFKDDLTVDQLTSLMRQFISDVDRGDYAEKGWPRQAYGVSKIGVSMLTRIQARDIAIQRPDIRLNCCCPGWVKTDMAGSAAPLTPYQGSATPVELCLLPGSAPTGRFWYNQKVQDW